MANIDLKTLELGEPAVNAKGAKSVPFTANKLPVTFTPDTPLQVVYEPSGYNDPAAERVNLVMRMTPELLEELTALDVYIVGLLALNSVKVFGKPLTEEEVKAKYSPIVKTSDKGYPPTFKVKLNVGVARKVRVWDAEKRPISAPEAWSQCTVVPKITLKSIWFLSKECGALLETTDVMIATSGGDCPF
jgi:hypothetical protein